MSAKWTRRFDDALPPSPPPAPQEVHPSLAEDPPHELDPAPTDSRAVSKASPPTTDRPAERGRSTRIPESQSTDAGPPAGARPRRSRRKAFGIVTIIALGVAGWTLARDPDLQSDKIRVSELIGSPHALVVTNTSRAAIALYVETSTGPDVCSYREVRLGPDGNQAFGPDQASLLDLTASSNCNRTRGKPVERSRICVGYCNVPASQVYLNRRRVRKSSGLTQAWLEALIALAAGLVYLLGPRRNTSLA